jgi:hypothetical protein
VKRRVRWNRKKRERKEETKEEGRMKDNKNNEQDVRETG